jgi:hypothetical protein
MSVAMGNKGTQLVLLYDGQTFLDDIRGDFRTRRGSFQDGKAGRLSEGYLRWSWPFFTVGILVLNEQLNQQYLAVELFLVPQGDADPECQLASDDRTLEIR